jgi:hypothetical protein
MPYSIVGMIHLSWKPIGSNEYANTNISTKGGRFPAGSQFDVNPYIILFETRHFHFFHADPGPLF